MESNDPIDHMNRFTRWAEPPPWNEQWAKAVGAACEELAAANSEVERLRKENAELQARYATLANEASNASLHNAFE